MKGSYHVIVQNRRIKFEFDVKRNITIIRGDSATGKTTLVDLIDSYQRFGDESGISVSCEKTCKTLTNADWELVIDNSKECIIFIDEDTNIVKTKEFAAKIKGSDNYYVIVTRENLPNLPYSVTEIYGIHNSGRYNDVRQTYNSFYRLYSVEQYSDTDKAEIVVVEDTNSGFEFFDAVVSAEIQCISAGGKTGIKGLVKDKSGKRILIIADGAAFGSEIGELYLYMQTHPEVSMYLPESFEWIILSSGLIDGNRVAEILENTENYVESADYFSWEQFYTKILISETKDTYLQYSKSHLNSVYLGDKEKDAIKNVIDVISVLIGLNSE